MAAIKIATLNVNGIADKRKRHIIFDYIRNQKYDITCLQETHGTNITTDDWTKEWGGKAHWNNGTHKSRGTAILFNPAQTYSTSDIKTDREGRILSLMVKTEHFECNIMTIYAPVIDKERKEFFKTLKRYVTRTRHIILTGDFNCVENITNDKQGGNPSRGKAGVAELTEITENLYLKDIWREKNPSERQYTWSNANLTIRARLDKIYISQELVTQAKAEITTCPFSDHNPVSTTILIPDTNARGPGYWKMNTTILTNKAYNHEMIAILSLYIKEKGKFETLAKWWENLKTVIKKVTIKHSVRLRKNERKKEKDLIETLQNLERQQNLNKEAIEDVKRKIKKITEQREKGTQIRSKARWIEEGEKPTRFFYNLEKQRQPKNTITKLETDNKIHTTDMEILTAARGFYQSLYTKEATDEEEQTWLTDQLEKQLDEISKALCEGQITTKETTTAVEKMQNNKTPGPDGIPKEFYERFWDILKDHMTELFNENYENTTMTESQKQAVLRLLYKKEERELLKNWRPISLLNVDYKIVATVMANRLRKVLPEIIHEDQTCGVPNRSIYENLFRLRDMTYNTRKNNTNMILVGLDQEKAFDRVDRTFLLRILQKMNFGPSFQKWILTLYTGAECQIINNGWLSDPIHIERGLRQGCPLSPLLYILVAETLGQAIRKEERIRGIHYPGGTGTTSKLVQYADDTTLTLNDEESVVKSFEIIHRFESGSGSKLNMDKTEGTYVGRQAGKTQGPVPIKWNKHITVLGTKIGQDLTQDWERKTEKMEKRLEIWSSRNLTIKGRAVLIKTYALATIMYLANVFQPPEEIKTRIQRYIFRFIWKKRTELISRRTMYMHESKGGLGIPNVKESIKGVRTKWIKKITEKEDNTTWLRWPRYYIGRALSTVKLEWKFLHDNSSPRADPTNIPPWYKEIIQTVKSHQSEFEAWNSQQITSKNIYDAIITKQTPRAEDKWKKEYNITSDISHTWEKIWKTPNTNGEREIIWKAEHRVLATKARLTKWGIAKSKKCPFCKETEDLTHALLTCKRLHTLWKKVQQLLNKICNRTYPLTLINIILQNQTLNNKTEEKLCRYILTVTIAIIWETRNQKLYFNKEPNPELYDYQKKRMRERIKVDKMYKNKQTLVKLWSYKAIICQYDELNDNLKMNI